MASVQRNRKTVLRIHNHSSRWTLICMVATLLFVGGCQTMQVPGGPRAARSCIPAVSRRTARVRREQLLDRLVRRQFSPYQAVHALLDGEVTGDFR